MLYCRCFHTFPNYILNYMYTNILSRDRSVVVVVVDIVWPGPWSHLRPMGPMNDCIQVNKQIRNTTSHTAITITGIRTHIWKPAVYSALRIALRECQLSRQCKSNDILYINPLGYILIVRIANWSNRDLLIERIVYKQYSI